ncbi:DUF5682 family protein [Candidatus Leptofilum sp.]|uniref:DUF5682 family protein n=1 Tax=Candidatus Leptofilum sp. TaxID=3241576 RepID=UPI003B5BC00B
MKPTEFLHLFPIRHHGPGSARALLSSLHELKPDAILVEGPPDANEIIHWLGHEDMEPPIALLVYRPDKPEAAGSYPFADFSPEFQALRYGVQHGIVTRFFDLPQTYMLATEIRPMMPDTAVFDQVASATGHADYELWWNALIEQRQDHTDLFVGVLELMQTMRNAAEENPEAELDEDTAVSHARARQFAEQREAHMRRAIRQARAEGCERIAVVCGAWHAPALYNLDSEAADDALLTNLPSVAVETAWVPWTYGRLSAARGYGAGIRAPGWYHHLWQMGQQLASPTQMSIAWLSHVAQLLRDQDLDASSAHIIEAVRLAESLAALRGLPAPGLLELNEATQTVLCFGDAAPMRLIQQQLIVGERMGAVPPDSPMIPLQRDLHQQQRRLRLRPEPEPTTLNLDLRNETHRERSQLLHRLNLLNVPWGKTMPIRAQSGTYQEVWQLAWQPAFVVRVIEAGVWGNTVETAVTNFATDQAQQAQDLPTLTNLLDQALLADLPELVLNLLTRIEEQAAVTSDVPHMMDALLPLARVLRYGDVRQTDPEVVRHVVDTLVTRICIGLPSTCASLDNDAAAEMLDRVTAVHAVIATQQNQDHLAAWEDTLRQLADQPGIHGLLAGKSTRLLLDTAVFQSEEAATRLERVLSRTATDVNQLAQMAFWIEGFLKGSGLLVLHDPTLWQLLDGWVTQLDPERFQTILPLLRRTFSTFSEAARQQLLDRARFGGATAKQPIHAPTFNEEQANKVLPLVAQLLGIKEIGD